MSLLMDALRKAEDAKRQADASAVVTPAAVELTLEPLGANAAPQATRLPDLAEHSAALDAGLSAIASEAPGSPGTPPPRTRTSGGKDSAGERAAARNVFTAKATAPARRSAWPLIVGAGIAAALAIVAYFAWQLRSLSNSAPAPAAQLAATPAPDIPTTPNTPTTPTVPPAPAAVAAGAPAAPPAQPGSVAGDRLPQPVAGAALPLEAPAAAVPTTRAAARRASVADTYPAPAAPVAARQRAARAEEPPAERSMDAALRLKKTHPPAQNTVADAFDALQAGRLDEAQRGYEQALRGDARSTDALLGLATIATRQGRPELAQAYYLRALEADPNNATAQAALINGRGQIDSGTAESRLKGALDAQPESSALLFALGNLYARQARWSEAQQAYFRAYAAEPDNADIIFNLAVALDHLRQNKLAAQYYQMALGAARAAGSATLFDRDQVRARILELQP